LRRQLEHLEQEYQQKKIQDLEQRLGALEQQKSAALPGTTQAVGSSVAGTGENAAKNVFLQPQTFQGQLPSEATYDLLQEAETKVENLERLTPPPRWIAIRPAVPSSSMPVRTTPMTPDPCETAAERNRGSTAGL
jgi:hypothetical protein